MPSGNQLKALIQSYLDGDDSHFYSVAMQIAAHEARLGHGKLARELRDLIDQKKKIKPPAPNSPIPLAQPKGELSSLLSVSYPNLKLTDMVLSSSTRKRLNRLIEEHTLIQLIRSHGLNPRTKVLLIGPPGTGKTMTASVLSGELGLPLFEVRIDSLMTKFMGETAAKLRTIFNAIQHTRGIYLFDEFDSIGSQRGLGNDVGEIRRVLNSFLQMIEHDNSDSILIAATNFVDLLDRALFRRFDDVIEYRLPEKEEIASFYKNRLTRYASPKLPWTELAEASCGLSYGELARVCESAIKCTIIKGKKIVSDDDLKQSVSEQNNIKHS